MAEERITVNRERMGGLPCIRDTRVTVSMVLGQLASGRSVEQLLADYPYLDYDDLVAALEYAAATIDRRAPYQRSTGRDSAGPCRRCGRPVRVYRDNYETFERMHWVCFHYEFEHGLFRDQDPDDDCGQPGCPSGVWW